MSRLPRGIENQFADHLRVLDRWLGEALYASAEAGVTRQGVVFHAGSAARYHADDMQVPFRPTPHMHRIAPICGPDHLIVMRPGTPARLIRVASDDYWYATPEPLEDWLLEALDVEQVSSVEAALAAAGSCRDLAFVGPDSEFADRLGIGAEAVEPGVLMAVLDWSRGYKSEFEVACIRDAQRIASLGHRVVRQGMLQGQSEFELHLAFLAKSEQLEIELPYPSIIAWDETAAVLHYQAKRRAAPEPGGSLLIDSGAQCLGYASDITRTYARPGAQTHPVFIALLDGMEALQQRLAARVAPGLDYVELHRSAEVAIGDLLFDLGLFRVSAEEARERGLVRAFFPHGLGHHLGLQVHDVAGQQVDARGTLRSPPEDCPHLRTTRALEAGHVVTIEPGVYFIPSLLEALRSGSTRDSLDWRLIDSLMPCGGIRIEDDVLVTLDGAENLTRPFVPGHLDEP